jgi:hypothetical protein
LKGEKVSENAFAVNPGDEMNVRVLVLSLLTVALLAGCGVNAPAAALNIDLSGGAPSQEKIAFPELVRGADRIVVGEVASAESAWNAEKTAIFTTVRLRVSESVKGSKPGDILLRVEGGQVGDIAQAVSGGLSFAQGEQVVLFLKSESVLGGPQGVYAVDGGKIGEQTLAAFLQQVRAVVN